MALQYREVGKKDGLNVDQKGNKHQSLYHIPKSVYFHKPHQRHILIFVYMANTRWKNIYTWKVRAHTPRCMIYITNKHQRDNPSQEAISDNHKYRISCKEGVNITYTKIGQGHISWYKSSAHPIYQSKTTQIWTET